MAQKKILVIGGLGCTARPIIDLLMNDYAITIYDIASCRRDDVCDMRPLRNAMAGIDIVIHLAVNIADTTNDELSFQVNVFGTFNVLEAARQMNVKKIIMASSAPVHTDTAARSPGEDFTYDLTKSLQELEAYHFSKTYAMHIMVLRLGHIVNGKKKADLNGVPLSKVAYCKGGWVCQYDVARAFKKAAELNFEGFHLLHIIGSYQAEDRFGLSAVKNILDFKCLERFTAY